MHFLFNFFQVFGSEGLVAQEFVEEAIFDRRADAELHVGIEFHHRGGQQMRGGMAEDVERVGIFFGEDLEFDVLLDRTAKVVEQAAIFGGIHGVRKNAGFRLGAVAIGGEDLGDQRSIGQSRRDGLGDLEGRGALGKVFYAAVGESYVNLIHESRPDLQQNCRGCS